MITRSKNAFEEYIKEFSRFKKGTTVFGHFNHITKLVNLCQFYFPCKDMKGDVKVTHP